MGRNSHYDPTNKLEVVLAYVHSFLPCFPPQFPLTPLPYVAPSWRGRKTRSCGHTGANPIPPTNLRKKSTLEYLYRWHVSVVCELLGPQRATAQPVWASYLQEILLKHNSDKKDIKEERVVELLFLGIRWVGPWGDVLRGTQVTTAVP